MFTKLKQEIINYISMGFKLNQYLQKARKYAINKTIIISCLYILLCVISYLSCKLCM